WAAAASSAQSAMVKICLQICRIIAAMDAHPLGHPKANRVWCALGKGPRSWRLPMLKRLVLSLALLAGFAFATAPVHAQGSVSDTFSVNEIVDKGGEFFGSVSQGLASLVERAAS